MRVGIYGGTFNPIHKGHIHYAKEAITQLCLDKLLLVVGSVPPHKEKDESVTDRNRFEMCELACRGIDKIEVSDIELVRGGVSYTVDTLHQLKLLYPNDELFLLTGTDMYLSIEEWKNPEAIFSMATVVGAPRLPEHYALVHQQKEELLAKGYPTEVVDISPIEISSTEVREGDEGQTDDSVWRYIVQNGLYGNEKKMLLDLDEMTQTLRNSMSKDRFTHSLNVANEAIRLADKYEADTSICYIAGLLHDICKEWPSDEQLKMLCNSAIIKDTSFLRSKRVWHGFAAAEYIKEAFGVYNTDIVDAVRYHSTACSDMTLVEKIIYMADLICPDRKYDGVEQLRIKAYKNLDEAMLEALQFIIRELVAEERPVLSGTLSAYNALVTTAEVEF